MRDRYEHETALHAVLDAGRPDAVARQHARGRGTARERIANWAPSRGRSSRAGTVRPSSPTRS